MGRSMMRSRDVATPERGRLDRHQAAGLHFRIGSAHEAVPGAVISSIKSILLHVDATAQSVVRLQIARDLAARHGAKVSALFAATSELDDGRYAYSAGAAADRAAELEQIRAGLQGRLSDDDRPVAWFDIVGERAARGFIEEAAYADLLVVGQQAAGTGTAGGAPAGFIESVILESGRPTLVIPVDGVADVIGQRVLVAWNGTVTAARALTAALPLLRGAAEVHVVSWSRISPVAPFSRVGIAEYLQRHGIAPLVHRREPSAHVGEELIATAERLCVDLVVMGCYGRSRASERILGGATRTVLGRMPVPMLMAH
ncbi:MAG: universal stress protein, partial [Caldimonas sp.]